MHAVSIATPVLTTQMLPTMAVEVVMPHLLATPPDLSLELWRRIVVMLVLPVPISLPPVSLKDEDQVKV